MRAYLVSGVDIWSELDKLLHNQNDTLVTGPVKGCLTFLHVCVQKGVHASLVV